MRFLLQLNAQPDDYLLPANYQYPFSSAIYKILQHADAAYAHFLHEKGYGQGNHKFKFFTFSDIQAKFRMQGDRMLLLDPSVSIIICFHLPNAAEKFIVGLFMNQQLEIADHQSRVVFNVSQVETLALPIYKSEENGMVTTMLDPISPIVVGTKEPNGHYNYRHPEDKDFGECLKYNWLEKYRAAYDLTQETIEALALGIEIKIHQHNYGPIERKPIIKANTKEQTKLRGYKRFGIEITAPKSFVELGLNAGVGLYNAMGMGGVGVM